MAEVHKLRAQISHTVETLVPGVDVGFTPKLTPPNDTQLKVLRQLLSSALVDRVAVRKDLVSSDQTVGKLASTRGVAYRTIGVNDDIYIHPSSVLFHSSPPDFVVFQELYRGTSKVWIKLVTKISPSWLSTLAKPLCTFTVVDQPGKLKQSATERECFVRPRYGGSGLEVDLPIIKATQRLQGTRWSFS